MFISILCLALLACLDSAVGAPVRFVKIYEPSEIPSDYWTQKQRLQHRDHYGEQDCPSAAVIENTNPWSAVVQRTRRPDDRPAAVDCRLKHEIISMTNCYVKAAGEYIDNDGDADISTHQLLVFLLIIAIAIFLLVYQRLNFVSKSRILGDTFTYSCIISIE